MTALQAGRILVTWDRDFNSQAFRQERFARLSRLSLSGAGPTLLNAVKEHIDLLEFKFPAAPKGDRIVAHVSVGQIKLRTG